MERRSFTSSLAYVDKDTVEQPPGHDAYPGVGSPLTKCRLPQAGCSALPDHLENTSRAIRAVDIYLGEGGVPAELSIPLEDSNFPVAAVLAMPLDFAFVTVEVADAGGRRAHQHSR